MMGEPFQSASLAGLPPMAVPTTVKMPEPMTMPMPSAVSETGPRIFLSACCGSSESEMSLSIDLVAKIWRGWLGEGRALVLFRLGWSGCKGVEPCVESVVQWVQTAKTFRAPLSRVRAGRLME